MAGKGKKTPKSGKKGKKTTKKGGKRSTRSFATYIFRVIRSQSKKTGVSSKGMAVLNGFVNHLLASVADEASALSRGHVMKASTVSAALRFALPGELGRRAASEGAKAVNKFSRK